MFVFIVGVNVCNEYFVNCIVGIVGYVGCLVEFIDEIMCKIDLLNDIECLDIGINDVDIFLMLKVFVEMGFKISLYK